MHDIHTTLSVQSGKAQAEAVESVNSGSPAQPATDPTANISYGHIGVRGVIKSPYVFFAAFIASMGGFSFGYDQGVISIINVMPEFHRVFPEAQSGFGKGFMTGMLELGAFLGCVFMPWLADRFSRKRALSFVVIIFNVGAILQTAAVNYEMLVLGRTIGGIGVGALAMGAPLYISEIAPPNLRGTLLVLESVSIVLGVVVAFWITYGTRHLVGEISFRLPFGLQMVSATVVGIGINMFPYSPRWLAMVGRDDEALESLAKLRRLPTNDDRIQQEFSGIVAEVRYQKAVVQQRHPGATGFKLEVCTWLDLFSLKLWRRVIVGCGVMFFQQFSGINAFIYYAPTLFQTLGQDYEMSLIMSGVFNMLQLVAVSLCFLIIDKVGRRPLAMIGGAGGAITWGIMAALVGVYSKTWSQHADAGWAAVAMAFGFILMYGCTYAPSAGRSLQNAMRSKGVALSTSTNWICNFIVGIITPPMLESWGFGTYLFYGAWCAIAVVWAWAFVVETKGKTLEQIDELFGDNVAKEEQDLSRITHLVANPYHHVRVPLSHSRTY
ncbi:general substrate transporter [Microdochium trichocladiopsis]|uniref:General substrate transporter n=1 Tax=Microdochium trichocladiopsis TaxID=1682393 RepID=A0A9P8XUV6_9PEZI|nr:general substrate transporter [Microdochium trichocladiopsis]KAH7014232.1 general substrate transporter [Microdochium trichocladiopsis]